MEQTPGGASSSQSVIQSSRGRASADRLANWRAVGALQTSAQSLSRTHGPQCFVGASSIVFQVSPEEVVWVVEIWGIRGPWVVRPPRIQPVPVDVLSQVLTSTVETMRKWPILISILPSDTTHSYTLTIFRKWKRKINSHWKYRTKTAQFLWPTLCNWSEEYNIRGLTGGYAFFSNRNNKYSVWRGRVWQAKNSEEFQENKKIDRKITWLIHLESKVM